jgi:CRISPR system Cascade subunit CasA
VLAAEHNADNAKVLFDHIDVQAPGCISEAEAARWLMATHTFSVSCGKSELSHTGTAPSATAAILLPVGTNLQDTLFLSLVPQSRHLIEGDQPIWEREPERVEELKLGVERESCGLADRYTWRTRSVRFQRDGEGIKNLAFASGIQSTSQDQLDPMQAYREIKDKGLLPLAFQERGLWREFDTLLPDQNDHSPQNIRHAVEVSKGFPARFPATVLILGQSNNKAKIEYWRMERFALPRSILGARFVREDIRSFLNQAQTSQSALWSACSTYARLLIARGERSPDKKDIRAFVDQMPCIPAYWSSLEAAFHALLQAYTEEAIFEVIHRSWLHSVREALRDAWNLHRHSARTGDAWAIRALVRAEGYIGAEQKKLDAVIREIDADLEKEKA